MGGEGHISQQPGLAGLKAGVPVAVDPDLKKGLLRAAHDPRQHQLLGWNIGADASFLLGGIMTIVGFVHMFRDPLPDSEGKIKDPVEFADLEEYSK